MQGQSIIRFMDLGSPWSTIDPFIFCVYHNDAYPAGNDQLGPRASLAGRRIGSDFSAEDGWNMYHGAIVPGFPAHPHRGFETVSIVRHGLIDHFDSLGASARYGSGDVQWLTAGRGIVHSEMFPLVKANAENPLEFFQIWLNLPAKSKMAEPHFKMLWAENIATATFADEQQRSTELVYVCGHPEGYANDLAVREATSPPPDSWASEPDSSLAIWTIKMAPHARWVLPGWAMDECRRALYFYRGKEIRIDDKAIGKHCGLELAANRSVELVNGSEVSELLMLQGKPIDEPIVQHGPFVMNTQTEIQQAISDYQETEFGGWSWPSGGPVHARDAGRHAQIQGEKPQFPPRTDEQTLTS